MKSAGSPPPDGPVISFVVTCKGRLAHLRRSLPSLMAQPQSEAVVVDYDCPDGAGAWAAQAWPAARVVRVADAPLFNISRARNLGAREALGQWLCFTDADSVLDEGFARHVRGLLEPGAYCWSSAVPGYIVCARDDFLAIEGYDEVLEGWGQEDMDLVLRLNLLGRACRALPAEMVTVIAHGDEERTRFHKEKRHLANNLINGLYLQAKRDLMLERGQSGLPRELRELLYAKAREAVLNTGKGRANRALTLTLTDHTVRFNEGWRIERVWRYALKPLASPGAGRGAGAAAPRPRTEE